MSNNYTFLQIIYLAISKLRTIFINPKIRLIRFPIDLRNKSQIKFGHKLTTGRGCRLEVIKIKGHDNKQKRIIFGCNIQINDYVHITAAEKVILEDNVLIASRVYISDCSHGSYGKFNINDSPETIPKDRKLSSMPIVIKKNVWLGEGVCVLMGVTIGEGSIIGANAVVTKDIPPYSIAVGSPAKVIKKFDTNLQKWIPVNRNGLN